MWLCEDLTPVGLRWGASAEESSAPGALPGEDRELRRGTDS